MADDASPPPPPPEPNFRGLPEKVILNIFSNFTVPFLAKTISRVCKSWWEISKDPSLWQEFHIHWQETCLDQIRSLLARCTKLKRLSISASVFGVPASCNIGEAFSSPTLVHLTIEDAVLFQRELTNLNTRFPSLESLSILKCNMYENRLEFIQTICELTALKSLKLNILALNQHFNDSFFNRIAENFTNLEILHMHNSSSLTNQCIINLARLRQNTLKEVKLSGSVLSDEAVSNLSLCPGLTGLGLSCTADITNSSFDALDDVNLQFLEFNCFTRRNDHVLGAAMSKFFKSPSRQSLTTLLLSGFWKLNNNVLAEIAQSCPNLVNFTFGGTQFVSDAGVYCLQGLPRLRFLKISECPRVTQTAVSLFPRHVVVDLT